ncbi:hypothetical protein SAMN04488073_2823 [Marinobacter gudaonensis]|uniref:Uncharacterized protein n=1 Tax=Marinobacter gudaonensis TaxID=375760 RepID=A0A1I6HNH8_9GAMM|nr:hypothetical protein [Marinobacter gudaonensis]SFR55996.1 hypothetical protein SAMN04488073_2823 [Marinobacter gudaonensis]
MIIRIFVALLALNLVAFVVRAEASERVFEEAEMTTASEEIFAIQERVSGDIDEDSSDAFAEIGSRLLSLTLSRSRQSGKHYASDPAQADHGIALLPEGACLNLKWNF